MASHIVPPYAPAVAALLNRELGRRDLARVASTGPGQDVVVAINPGDARRTAQILTDKGYLVVPGGTTNGYSRLVLTGKVRN